MPIYRSLLYQAASYCNTLPIIKLEHNPFKLYYTQKSFAIKNLNNIYAANQIAITNYNLPGVIKPKPLLEKNLTFPVQAILNLDI